MNCQPKANWLPLSVFAKVSLSLAFVAAAQQSDYIYDLPGNLTTVIGTNAVPLGVTTQPQSALLYGNNPVTLSVVASGAGLSYQWRSNGVAIVDATNDSIIFRNLSGNNLTNFTVVISNTSGCVTSTPAAIWLDSRGVGMPDWWQMKYFGNLNQPPDGDYDGDGVCNLDEYLEGTDPTNPNSYDPRLHIQQANLGTLVASPAQPYYTMGQVITLTAVPNPGQMFLGWGGSATGTKSTIALVMNSNTTVSANFGLPLEMALNNSNLIWTTGGSAPWFGQSQVSYDGVGAAQSGTIVGGQQSWLQAVTTNVTQSFQLAFWWNVSSQSPDALSFTIDGTNYSSIAGPAVGWQHVVVNLTAGVHTLVWTYTKQSNDNPTGIPFADSGWVGDVTFGPVPVITAQPIEQVVPQGGEAAFSVGVAATPPINFQWFFNGVNLVSSTNAALSLTNVTAANAGNYMVVVSNMFGAATSAVAQLVVLVPGCVSPPLGLVSWWPGDGNAVDLMGGNNGTLHNGAGFASGEVGQAFSFNGTNQYMATTNEGMTNITNTFTMEFWAYPTASLAITTEGNSGISGTCCQRYAIFPSQSPNGSATAGAGVSVGTNGISVFELAPNYMPSLLVYPAPILGWTHVAVVYQNKQPTLYVNGVLVGVGQTSTRSAVYPSAELGGDPNGYGYYAGLLDEVSIYNLALSASEVQSIYNAGIAGMCKPEPEVSSISSTSGAAGNVISIQGTNLAAVAAVMFNGMPAQFVVQSSGRLIAYVPINATTGPLTLETLNGGTVTASGSFAVAVPGCLPPPAGIADWWPGEGNALDLVTGNIGTLAGGVTFAPGEVGEAFSFDGSSGYVSVPHSSIWDFGTNDFTIEFWANFNSTSGAQAFIACDNGSGAQNKWILFYGYVGQSLTFLSGASAINIGNFQFLPNTGQWYHIAVTRGGSAWIFYVDGVAIGTETETVTVPTMTAPLTIGNAEGAFYFKGLMDEVSIYTRALSAIEVQSIYNAGSAGKCNGVTFDTSPAGLQWTTNGLQLRLNGLTEAGPVVIYASTNLTAWTPIFTNPPASNPIQFLDTNATNFGERFYRATSGQ